jgi:hypothetical protein
MASVRPRSFGDINTNKPMNDTTVSANNGADIANRLQLNQNIPPNRPLSGRPRDPAPP